MELERVVAEIPTRYKQLLKEDNRTIREIVISALEMELETSPGGSQMELQRKIRRKKRRKSYLEDDIEDLQSEVDQLQDQIEDLEDELEDQNEEEEMYIDDVHSIHTDLMDPDHSLEAVDEDHARVREISNKYHVSPEKVTRDLADIHDQQDRQQDPQTATGRTTA